MAKKKMSETDSLKTEKLIPPPAAPPKAKATEAKPVVPPKYPKETKLIKVNTSALPNGDRRILKMFLRAGDRGWAGEERLSGDLSAPGNFQGLMLDTAECLRHLRMRRHQVRATHIDLMELGAALDSVIELLED